MVLPLATATISTLPRIAQPSPASVTRQSVSAVARPSGLGGVSVTSSAAGRNARACREASSGGTSRSRTERADMGLSSASNGLDAMQVGIAAAPGNQLLMGAVFDDRAVLDGEDAVGAAHGGEPVCDDQHGATLDDVAHVALDNALGLVVERRGRLVKNQ